MTEREALKLARQLLWRYRHETPMGDQPHMICQEVDEAFERIDEALAQPEQEPVGEVYGWHGHGVGQPLCRFNVTESDMPVGSLLYTTPQQRTWVGLTDEEMVALCQNGFGIDPVLDGNLRKYAKAIEAKLKEKNT